MNMRFFYLITVFVACLFSGFFTEVKADCTIDYYISFSTTDNPSNELTLSGDDPQFPFINWTRPNADEIRVYDDETSELLYHLTGAIPRSIQYGDYSQPGTAKGEHVDYDVAPPLELNHFLYTIEIKEAGRAGDIFGVVITGVTCEEEEGFVLTNTSDCEGAAGDLAVPQDIGRCEVKLNDVPLAPYSSRELKELDLLSQNKESKSSINVHCLGGLQRWLDIMYSDLLQEKDIFRLFILILFLEPSICDLSGSNSYQAVDSYKISLGLQSGGGHFKPAIDSLALDIETSTAKVSSVAQNDFGVGHDPDTTLTVAACYEGSVTVDPTNPALSSVALLKGQQVKVWSDRIGPVTRIPQTNILPVLMLLKEE